MQHPAEQQRHTGDLVAAAAVYVLVVVVGFGVGLIGSFSQAATRTLVGVDLPVGLVASLVVTLAVIVGAGLSTGSRVGAGLAFAGWLLATMVMAVKRPEGDLVVAATPLGLVWLFGGTVLGGLALAWPYGQRLRPRR
ncbi:MAG TPA: DUF6113 family protein [Actinomycetes bacterium]|nr:DUF6113 family protein [Actinomycetes bacterium]